MHKICKLRDIAKMDFAQEADKKNIWWIFTSILTVTALSLYNSPTLIQ